MALSAYRGMRTSVVTTTDMLALIDYSYLSALWSLNVTAEITRYQSN